MAARGAVATSQGAGTGQPADVAPTVLHALGVPISRELAGAPLDGLFSGAFLTRFPVREVASYGRRTAPTEVRKGQPLDQEMIERLRSLGYVR
jgi:arylsulfatase A-like enzyme